MNAGWQETIKRRFGPSQSFAKRAWPDLTSSTLGLNRPVPERVFLFTDWAGEHGSAVYQTFSLLFVDGQSLSDWLEHVERHQLQTRLVAYKRLRDAIRRQELLPFLHSANSLNGILITVAFHRDTPSDFSPPSDPELRKSYDEYRDAFGGRLFEKLMRTIDLTAYFMALLVPESTAFVWISDDDAIVDTPERKGIAAGSFRRLVALSCDTPVRSISMSTISGCTSQRDAEIASALPDLSAGAVGDMLAELMPGGLEVVRPVWQKLPEFRDLKIDYLIDWLRTNSPTLTRITFVCSKSPDGKFGSARFLSIGSGPDSLILPVSYHIERLRRKD